MLELSHHILDIAENATRAGARVIRIDVMEDQENDRVSIEICDDGSGMDAETLRKAMDPFFTSKKVRRVGLGLPMLAEAAERTGGRFEIESKIGVGTRVRAEFGYAHIDRQPIGDIPGTLVALIVGNPNLDLIYRHQRNGETFVFDTAEIKSGLDGVPIDNVEILNFLRGAIGEGLKEIGVNTR